MNYTFEGHQPYYHLHDRHGYVDEQECGHCRVVCDQLLARGVANTVCGSLITALHYHPQDWQPLDVEEVAVDIDDGSDEPNFTWVLKVKEQWLAVRGWHDYTGWDCRSDLNTERYASKEDAMRTLVDWEREILERRGHAA